MKSFALNLAFIVRFTATRKWPIVSEKCVVTPNLLFRIPITLAKICFSHDHKLRKNTSVMMKMATDDDEDVDSNKALYSLS